MLIDLTRLRNGIDSEVIVKETYSFSKDELAHTDVTSIDNVQIEGVITLDSMSEIYLELSVHGTMIIPCAITLKPVEYPFSISIEGTLEEIMDENQEKTTNYQNSLDILPIIWENILMEIPMRVVSEGAEELELSGDGWKLVTDNDKVENSELSKLKDLL